MDWKFATTLIGSQPFKDAKVAVSKILDGKVMCPSWPQMPVDDIRQSMYVQTGIHLPGLKTDSGKPVVDVDDYDPTEIYTAILSEDVNYFEYPKDVYSGFYELMDRDVSAFTAVKGQVTGPISEGLQIFDKNDRPVIYNESYCEIVRKTVNMSAKWQAKKLSEKNDNVIIFFDEPSLSTLGTPFTSVSDEEAKAWINESLEGVDCFRAVHCCGNTNWSMVLSTNIDILSIDAYQYSDNLLMYPDDLTEFFGKGGSIAWGIIPTSDAEIVMETVDSLTEKLDSIFDKLEQKGINRKKATERSLITPQCGFAGICPENVDKLLELLTGVSAKMKERYGFK